MNLQLFGGRGGSGKNGGKSQTAQTSGAGSIGAFSQLSDAQKATAVAAAVAAPQVGNLPDTTWQKMIHQQKLDNLPQIVDDKAFEKVKGFEMYRTFNGDGTTSSGQIAQNLMTDQDTFHSVPSALGRGLYFAGALEQSLPYGNSGDIGVVRAKIDTSKAKIISTSAVDSGVSREISRGTELGKQLANISRADQRSIYAAANGYNVITRTGKLSHAKSTFGSSYTVVLDRSILTFSSTVVQGDWSNVRHVRNDSWQQLKANTGTK